MSKNLQHIGFEGDDIPVYDVELDFDQADAVATAEASQITVEPEKATFSPSQVAELEKAAAPLKLQFQQENLSFDEVDAVDVTEFAELEEEQVAKAPEAPAPVIAMPVAAPQPAAKSHLEVVQGEARMERAAKSTGSSRFAHISRAVVLATAGLMASCTAPVYNGTSGGPEGSTDAGTGTSSAAETASSSKDAELKKLQAEKEALEKERNALAEKVKADKVEIEKYEKLAGGDKKGEAAQKEIKAKLEKCVPPTKLDKTATASAPTKTTPAPAKAKTDEAHKTPEVPPVAVPKTPAATGKVAVPSQKPAQKPKAEKGEKPSAEASDVKVDQDQAFRAARVEELLTSVRGWLDELRNSRDSRAENALLIQAAEGFVKKWSNMTSVTPEAYATIEAQYNNLRSQKFYLLRNEREAAAILAEAKNVTRPADQQVKVPAVPGQTYIVDAIDKLHVQRDLVNGYSETQKVNAQAKELQAQHAKERAAKAAQEHKRKYGIMEQIFRRSHVLGDKQ